MTRPYRLQLEDCLYHITSRGDDRKKVFISKYDYEKFLEYLRLAKDKYKFYLYAYCLITNHYHLLIETTQPNLSRIMQYINSSYTIYYNTKRRRCGHVFQGRYKSIVVEKDSYFLELTRYIHLNPVRAKIVTDPSKYEWSSCRGYIKKKGNAYIDEEYMRRYFDMSGKQYQDFALEGINKQENPFKDIYAGFILGRTKFIKDKLKRLKGQIEGGEVSYRKKINSSLDIDSIVRAVSRKYGQSVNEICKAKRKPLLSKKIAIYLSKRLTGLTNREIGEFFGIGHSAVSKAAMDISKLAEKDKTVKREIEGFISHFEV